MSARQIIMMLVAGILLTCLLLSGQDTKKDKGDNL